MRSSSDCRHWHEFEGVEARLCSVAAAVIGAGVVGAVGSSIASGNAEDAANNATAAETASAQQSAALGQANLAFQKQQYSDAAPMRQLTYDTAKAVSGQQLATMQQQNQQAADTYAYQTGTFRPVEQKLVADAQAYDTPERRDAAQAAARSDVEQAFGSTQDALSRSIGRTGATVGSGRALAMMQDQQFAKANALAGATTQATRNVEQQGYARMADAANLGRNLASNQATQVSLGLNAGNSAVANSATGLNAATSGTAQVGQAYSTAIGANNAAGSLYGQVANIQNSVANTEAAGWNSLGSTAGLALAKYYSDETMKTGTGRRIDTKKALQQIQDTPVDEGWQYDPDKGGPNDDGAPHDGPMAQAVRRTMGEHVAPGGKHIDVASMNGKILAGMQELGKRLDRLEDKPAPAARKRASMAEHGRKAA